MSGRLAGIDMVDKEDLDLVSVCGGRKGGGGGGAIDAGGGGGGGGGGGEQLEHGSGCVGGYNRWV